MRWAEIAVDADCSSADAAAAILIEEGCGGTATGGSSASVCPGPQRVLGYLPVDDRLEARLSRITERVRRLPELGLSVASTEVTVRWVEEEDWQDGWKQFFRPLKVGRIVVAPSWERYPAQPDEIVIELDPGMAFGTGYHETTRLCLQALQDVVKGGETVLDVGTGSGILAIAAVRLGAASAIGLDIDPVAVEVARANVSGTGLRNGITLAQADSPAEFGTADIVVANILASVIIDMAAHLAACTNPGGVLIASGILGERAAEVAGHLQKHSMQTTATMHEGDWAAIILTRKRA